MEYIPLQSKVVRLEHDIRESTPEREIAEARRDWDGRSSAHRRERLLAGLHWTREQTDAAGTGIRLFCHLGTPLEQIARAAAEAKDRLNAAGVSVSCVPKEWIESVPPKTNDQT